MGTEGSLCNGPYRGPLSIPHLHDPGANARGKALEVLWCTLWGLVGVDLQGVWVMAQVKENKDLRVHVQVKNDQ